ncbi:conserved exported protein of unknown function [Thermococcus nautili]|uniref:Uncharacterized protein n=2 Tax=Thermococcaceae TaxID=2259 RepID=W8PMX5_9EURY|nr:hypothetical protein BD01_1786 [Thermococcus nautili]NJE49602.1 hypothetical protein [Thermococcus sp. 9N3]CAI1492635.1 conserved exported protein of unknown function [Thermococcus nautili]
MRRLLSLLLLFTLLFSLPAFSLAQDYTLPGTLPGGMSYNNIGLLGEIMVDFNVTLVNTAPYPKYVLVNPRYDFRVLRGNGSEYLYNYRTATGELQGAVSRELLSKSVNYLVGFWLAPYETVVVNFRITENSSYLVPLLDFNSPCGDAGRLTKLTYENGTLVSAVLDNNGGLDSLVCGSVYPRLINRPTFLSVRSMFPILDRNVKVLKYEGLVDFRITNVPNFNSKDKLFHVFFAVAQPVIFLDGETYDYTPNYTMTYQEYLQRFVWGYSGVNGPAKRAVNVTMPENNLFKLTDTLISGVRVGSPVSVDRKPYNGPDFPVWVVFMGDRIDITYRVSWNNNSGR